MKKIGYALVLLAAACSPGETAESTTSSPSTSITSTSTTEATTTTTPTTTTTAAPGPTTTAAATTTTLLAGDWADQALITTEFGALGWWNGADWLDAETEGGLPVVGGEDYQTILGSSLGMTTAGPQTTVCEPLGLIGVELADPDLLGEFPGPYGVAISAPYDLQPYLYDDGATDDGTYADFASGLLASRGLVVDDPPIKQLVRTDLEGDGVNEVLVVAEEVTTGFLMQPGDYSILFMRKVIEGEVQTAVLGVTVALDEDDQFLGAHSVGTVADLNGDGKMEIITNSAFFEGFSVAVWEYVDDDLGPTLRLERGCGS
ncbi:MAG TPA: hypothetical protein VF115_09725 [Acidimicrobiia bacterium]